MKRERRRTTASRESLPDRIKNRSGYRMEPGAGPVVRTDVVDVYVFRRRSSSKRERTTTAVAARVGGVGTIEFLQVRRSSAPLAGTWHPVMGHIEAGESAAECAVREAREELGLEVLPRRRAGATRGGAVSESVLGFWALEQVHPFYIAAINMIVMSPRFAVEVTASWEPRLNDEHTARRWVYASEVETHFMWPGQAAACREVVQYIAEPQSLARARLKIGRLTPRNACL